MEERLQKILAKAGIASRRAAEEIIVQGRVTVDGRVVTKLGEKADPLLQRIEVDGKPLASAEEKVYLLLNKPKGFVTTMHDPQGRPIAASLLHGVTARVYPVGRLDMDSEGALLFTNDGDFAHRILHPKHGVNKTYQVRVAGRPTTQSLKKLAGGVEIDGRRTWPAQLKVLRHEPESTVVAITIHEGRKHQVRLMFAAIGHPVLTLKRTAYGDLQLGDLPSGKFLLLGKNDLKRMVG